MFKIAEHFSLQMLAISPVLQVWLGVILRPQKGVCWSDGSLECRLIKEGAADSRLCGIGIDHPVRGWHISPIGHHSQHVPNVAHEGAGLGRGINPLPSPVLNLKCCDILLLVHECQKAIVSVSACM